MGARQDQAEGGRESGRRFRQGGALLGVDISSNVRDVHSINEQKMCYLESKFLYILSEKEIYVLSILYSIISIRCVVGWYIRFNTQISVLPS